MLDKLTRSQLMELDKEITEQIKRRERIDRQTAVDRIYGIAHSIGMPLSRLLSIYMKNSPKSDIQYADPTDKSKVWSGRSRRPFWLKSALDTGKSLDDFLV